MVADGMETDLAFSPKFKNYAIFIINGKRPKFLQFAFQLMGF